MKIWIFEDFINYGTCVFSSEEKLNNFIEDYLNDYSEDNDYTTNCVELDVDFKQARELGYI